jgi:uncharacterized membrane protein YkoI
MRIRSLIATAVTAMALSVPVFAQSQTSLNTEHTGFGPSLSGGTKVPWDQVPAAVRQAVESRAGKVQVEDVDKGTINGRTFYEVAYKAEGQHNEMRVSEDGKTVKVMEGGQVSNAFAYPLLNDKNVAWSDVPPNVQSTILAQASGAKVRLVRRGTLHGRVVYEAMYPGTGTQFRYARVADDGKLLARSEGSGRSNVTSENNAGRVISSPATAPSPIAGSGKVLLSQLPAAAQSTIRQYAGAAQIEDIDKDTTHGPVTYEASFKRNGQQNELKVAEDGRVVQWTENGQIKEPSGAAVAPATSSTPNSSAAVSSQTYSEGQGKVKFEDLPEAAKKSIQQYAGGASIEDIDRTTKNGETTFEAAFKKDGKHNELTVKADGSVVQRTEDGVKVQ